MASYVTASRASGTFSRRVPAEILSSVDRVVPFLAREREKFIGDDAFKRHRTNAHGLFFPP